MKFQAFHVNPGEKLKEKDVNNDLSNFMSVFPTTQVLSCNCKFVQMIFCNRYYDTSHLARLMKENEIQ